MELCKDCKHVVHARDWRLANAGRYDDWRKSDENCDVLLAAYAAHCTAEKDRQIKMLELKTSNSLANNLCPDHRDKQIGKSCLACTIEQKDAEITRLKDVLSAARQYVIYVESFASCGFKSLKDVIDAYDRAALQEKKP